MTPAQEALSARVRGLLEGRLVREVNMFGGRAFMVDERLAVSVGRSGDLLVRVPAERHEEFLEQPGVSQATMAQGRRTMGPGWITVEASVLETDDQLAAWLDAAGETHAAG